MQAREAGAGGDIDGLSLRLAGTSLAADGHPHPPDRLPPRGRPPAAAALGPAPQATRPDRPQADPPGKQTGPRSSREGAGPQQTQQEEHEQEQEQEVEPPTPLKQPQQQQHQHQQHQHQQTQQEGPGPGAQPTRQGAWTPTEHLLFLEGYQRYGTGSWKAIAAVVGTRTSEQVRTHAQKHFKKLQRKEAGGSSGSGGGSGSGSGGAHQQQQQQEQLEAPMQHWRPTAGFGHTGAYGPGPALPVHHGAFPPPGRPPFAPFSAPPHIPALHHHQLGPPPPPPNADGGPPVAALPLHHVGAPMHGAAASAGMGTHTAASAQQVGQPLQEQQEQEQEQDKDKENVFFI